MNENQQQDSFEQELKVLRPAKPSVVLRRGLERQFSGKGAGHGSQERAFPAVRLLRWLVPLAGAAMLLIAAVTIMQPAPKTNRIGAPFQEIARSLPVRADEVQVEHQLVSDFDAIGRLHTGEPVRVRCREWRDAVTLRDSRTDVVVERTTPRLEILNVRYDTY